MDGWSRKHIVWICPAMYIKVENSNARAGSIDTRRLVELEHLCVVLKVQGCDIGVFFSVRESGLRLM